MENSLIIITIVLMALVTVVPRILPVWVFAGKKFPKAMVFWLKYVPIAVLAALLAPELLLVNNRFDLGPSNSFFWVSIPTFIVGAVTKNLFITIAVGMGGLALVRFVFGL